jgi:hypothetical protein
MIKKTAIACLFTIIFSATSAWAAGIGVYGTGGPVFSTWYINGEKSGGTTDYFYGGGLVIDSNVAKNIAFGYRFTGGYEQYVLENPDTGYTGEPIHRISMSHTFGFGAARTDMIRFWVGPRIGLHYLFKSESYYSLGVYPLFWPPFILILPQKRTVDIDAIGLDLLLALGLNINMGDNFTLFFDVGFGYMGNYNINISEMGHAFGLDAKAGIMFRIKDTYALADNKAIEIKTIEVK